MDCKVTKQGVLTNQVLYDRSVEQPIDTDFTLPDYCRDIKRVLKCKITPRVSSRSISGDSLTVEGTVAVCLFYVESENEQICSYEHIEPFTKIIDTGTALDNATARVKIWTDYANCRAVTERRVDVHGALTLQVCISRLAESSIVTDIDGGGVQMLRHAAPATSPVGCAEKFLVLNDEIEIPDNMPPVASILRSDARAVCEESKIISNKIITKGRMLLNVLYFGEGGEMPQSMQHSIPMSQLLDIDGVSEACTCTVNIDVVSLELRVRTGLTGEARSLVVSAKLCVTATAFCNSDIPMLFDAYSTDYAMEIERADITFEKVAATVLENYLCKKKLDFPSGSIDKVVDLWCETGVSSSKCENGKVIIAGTVIICMLVLDSDGAAAYYERPVEFEYSNDINCSPAISRCEAQAVALNASYNLTGDGVEVKVELSLHADIIESQKVSPICEASIDEKSPKKNDNSAALVIYYAEKGEAVWDIARRYNTAASEIASANSLTDDKLSANRMLLIPRK
jgi:LysM repeat protein